MQVVLRIYRDRYKGASKYETVQLYSIAAIMRAVSVMSRFI